MTRSRDEALGRALAFRPLDHRRGAPRLKTDRADVIVGGANGCLGVMDDLDLPSLPVSDGGLRELVLAELLSHPRLLLPASNAP